MIHEIVLEEWIKISTQASFDKYIQDMSQDAMGDLFTLIAASQVYDATIHVFKHFQTHETVGSGSTQIVIGYYPEYHYVSTEVITKD